MKSNYQWGVLGSMVCMGAVITNIHTKREVVRIEFEGANSQLMARRAARIVKLLDKIDREIAKEVAAI
jgi:hypothetical protein